MPLAVFFGASQLAADRKRRLENQYAFQGRQLETENDSAVDGDFQACMDALRKVQSFNHLARDHLAVLESQEFVLGGL